MGKKSNHVTFVHCGMLSWFLPDNMCRAQGLQIFKASRANKKNITSDTSTKYVCISKWWEQWLSSIPGPHREASLSISGHTIGRRGFQWWGSTPHYRDEVAAYFENKTLRDTLLMCYRGGEVVHFPILLRLPDLSLPSLLSSYSAASEKSTNGPWNIQLKLLTVDDVFFLHTNLNHHAKHQIV